MNDKNSSLRDPAGHILSLVEKSKDGELQAYGELVRIYRERAYGLAFSFSKHHHDAEDISQEAFIKAFEKIGTFDPRVGSFGSWLLKIVANLSINKMRWNKVRKKFLLFLDSGFNGPEERDSPALQIADPNKNLEPEANAERSWESARIAGAMASISPQQRMALHLKYIEGYKLSEISKIMRLAEGTVKSHVFRGIEGLKKIMKEPRELEKT